MRLHEALERCGGDATGEGRRFRGELIGPEPLPGEAAADGLLGVHPVSGVEKMGRRLGADGGGEERTAAKFGDEPERDEREFEAGCL